VRLGVAFLLGVGGATLALFAGVWTPWVLLLVPLALWIAPRARTGVSPIDAAAGITLCGYAMAATAAAPAEHDFLAIWGLKARVFFEHGGVDWAFLRSAHHVWSHPDYPPLVPLTFDLVALASGGWSDRWLGVVYVLFAAAAVLVVRDVVREELGGTFSSLVTLILTPLLATPWIGLGDGIFVAYATAGVLLARRGDLTIASLLLGFAAMTKNEGLTLFLAVAIVLGTRARKLWPGVLVAAPWLVARLVVQLPTDLAGGSVFDRVMQRDFVELARLLVVHAGRPLLWIGIAAAIAFGRKERFLTTVVALQLAAYVAAYVITPYDPAWHVRWSWERLLSHVLPLLVFSACVRVRGRDRGGDDRDRADAYDPRVPTPPVPPPAAPVP
jgi:hypothetical protein